VDAWGTSERRSVTADVEVEGMLLVRKRAIFGWYFLGG
jgi:hypothetical protein